MQNTKVDGRKLAALREGKFLERWELAKRARVRTNTVGYLEREEYPGGTRLTTIRRLAEALEVDPHEILVEVEDK